MNRPNKFSAQPTEIDGIRFASRAEASRYAVLKLEQMAKLISRLELQPKFDCIVNGVKVCTYIADFVYLRDNERVVEDVKGHRTPDYRIKVKLVEALYPGVKIVEIYRGKVAKRRAAPRATA